MATTSNMAPNNITCSLSNLFLRHLPPPPISTFAAGATILLRGPRHVSYHRRIRASDPKTEADVVDTAASTSSVPRPDFQDDSIYIGKLAVGSIVGAGVIKYGSVVFPSITSPNLFQALLMVSIPMVVAVLLLLRGSREE
ncbi:hypothetical protein Droror1_Dr00010037 [Drosera rotundifolia]